jgi:uracil-DNA glycosylase
MVILKNDWAALLKEEFAKPYFVELERKLKEEYLHYEVYPKSEDLLAAFQLCSYADTKAVILGQDPYHGAGQAHGLSFSVKPGVMRPPSLLNIFKELQLDLGCRLPDHGCLTHWAEQGVLLMNTVLTVRAGRANSHRDLGWQTFTDHVISLLNRREKPVVFILWGNSAQQKTKLITAKRHCIIQSVHPSPLSSYKGFFGSRPFSKTNQFLQKMGSPVIDWQIPNLDEQLT